VKKRPKHFIRTAKEIAKDTVVIITTLTGGTISGEEITTGDNTKVEISKVGITTTKGKSLVIRGRATATATINKIISLCNRTTQS
jgi:hypothetical protein